LVFELPAMSVYRTCATDIVNVPLLGISGGFIENVKTLPCPLKSLIDNDLKVSETVISSEPKPVIASLNQTSTSIGKFLAVFSDRFMSQV